MDGYCVRAERRKELEGNEAKKRKGREEKEIMS